jgi:peptide deformylase
MSKKLKIIQIGDPILRQQARALSPQEIRSDSMQQLIALMQDTLRNAPGVGLAAPQIGESIQLAVIEDRQEYHQNFSSEQLKERNRIPVDFHVIINPKIIVVQNEEVEFFEGCLSIAGFVGLVPRLLNIEVECLNERAEPTIIKTMGWYARILQHEINHLNEYFVY